MKKKLTLVLIVVLMGLLLINGTGCSKTETFVQKSWNRTGYGISGIIIEDISAEVSLIPSTDGQIHILYYESEYSTYNVNIDANGVLSFILNRAQGPDATREPSGMRLNTVVAVPTDFDGDVALTTVDGNILLDAISITGNLTAETVTGNITVTDSKLEQGASLSTTDGNVLFRQSVIAAGKLYLNTISGSISSDSAMISGNIDAVTVSGDILFVKTTAGDVSCVATTGNINIAVFDRPQGYRVIAETTSGSIKAPNSDAGMYVISTKTVSGNTVVTLLS